MYIIYIYEWCVHGVCIQINKKEKKRKSHQSKTLPTACDCTTLDQPYCKFYSLPTVLIIIQYTPCI